MPPFGKLLARLIESCGSALSDRGIPRPAKRKPWLLSPAAYARTMAEMKAAEHEDLPEREGAVLRFGSKCAVWLVCALPFAIG
eukprot:scaffold114259_cov31-Tisochrysis_lutea.AAC.5